MRPLLLPDITPPLRLQPSTLVMASACADWTHAWLGQVQLCVGQNLLQGGWLVVAAVSQAACLTLLQAWLVVLACPALVCTSHPAVQAIRVSMRCACELRPATSSVYAASHQHCHAPACLEI